MVRLWLYGAMLLVFSAQKCAPVADLHNHNLNEPIFSVQDSPYAKVFLPLDGIWMGQFETFEDSDGQKKLNSSIELDTQWIKSLKRTGTIHVRQEYQSITPYFQKVKIRDTYFENGDTTVVVSKGVNKVENGRLWCIVEKPNEKIVHEGSWQPPNTIIWSRFIKEPLKKEYFVETVSDDQYQIAGYGYYGSDDPSLSPKTWFFATYRQVSDYFR